MTVAASFLAMVGVPFLVSAALGTVHTRRVVRLAMIASVPVTLAVLLYLGNPYSLDELGVGVMAFLAALGWVAGFGAAPIIRGLWRLTTRAARPL